MRCSVLKRQGVHCAAAWEAWPGALQTPSLHATVLCVATPLHRVMYDRSCRLWGLLWNVMRQLPRAAAKNRGGRDSKAALFWSAHQRFYRQMLIASKVGVTEEMAG